MNHNLTNPTDTTPATAATNGDCFRGLHTVLHTPGQRARCAVATCGRTFAWSCSTSPDSTCHYMTSPSGIVQLADGRRVQAPDGHDENLETMSSCIYCQQPFIRADSTNPSNK